MTEAANTTFAVDLVLGALLLVALAACFIGGVGAMVQRWWLCQKCACYFNDRGEVTEHDPNRVNIKWGLCPECAEKDKKK